MIHTETPQSVDELDPWRPQGGRRVNQMGLHGSRHVTGRDSSTKTSNGDVGGRYDKGTKYKEITFSTQTQLPPHSVTH